MYRAKSYTSVFLAGMFLFVPSDTFAVGCRALLNGTPSHSYGVIIIVSNTVQRVQTVLLYDVSFSLQQYDRLKLTTANIIKNTD